MCLMQKKLFEQLNKNPKEPINIEQLIAELSKTIIPPKVIFTPKFEPSQNLLKIQL